MIATTTALPYSNQALTHLPYVQLKAVFKSLVPDCRRWLNRHDMRQYIQVAQRIDRISLKVCQFVLDKLVSWVQAIYKKSEPKPVAPQPKTERSPLHAYIDFTEVPEGFSITRNLSGLAMDLDVDYSVKVRQSVGELLIGRIIEQGRGIQAIPTKKGKPSMHFNSTKRAIAYLAEQAKVKPYAATEPVVEVVAQPAIEVVLPFDERRKSLNTCPLYKGDKVEISTDRKSKQEYDGEVATVRNTTQVGGDINVLVEVNNEVVLLERFECYLIGATQLLIA